MFNKLNERFARIVKNLSGQGRLTEDNIKDTLRDIRLALLEADVALPIVKEFIEDVRTRGLGQEVQLSLNPGQAVIKQVHAQLIEIMGKTQEPINLNCPAPAVILMAGLQGCGKTTTVGKLAVWLKEQKKSVLLASTDVYRPAAIEQLKTIANNIDTPFFEHPPQEKPVQIAKQAIDAAKKQHIDVVILDTAGRMHIDNEMMDEIKQMHAATHPIETLFVVDSMTGQDAAKTAKAFHDALPLTGVVLTKVDGDARGGAALSVRKITGKPIKFIGTGEKLSALEPFYPERIASRILGMGDVLTLIEDIEKKVDVKKAKKLEKKVKKGNFDLEDYRDQLQQMQKMGGMMGLMSKLPGMSQLPDQVKKKVNDDELMRAIPIINSMTPQERRFPALLKGSRKRRIAAGSGTSVPEINRLLKQFKQMQTMMRRVAKKGGMNKMMRNMQGMLPPGMGGNGNLGSPF